MRRRTARAVIRVAAVVAAVVFAAVVCAAQDKQPIGVVLDISGPVYLRLATGMAEIQLDAKRDLGRALFEGQVLRCEKGGRLRAVVNGEVKELRATDKPLDVKPPGNLSPEQARVMRALREYGSPGGTRGGAGGIYAPAEGGAVRVERFEIRWVVDGKKGKARLKIEAEGGEELWAATGVDAAAGRLAAVAEVRAALVKYGKAGERLKLTMTEASGSRSSVEFWILTRREEEELKQELAEWDGEKDVLLQAIGRAQVFSGKRVYGEAAGEYEAALKIAPESRGLLEAAMEANRRTGNTARVAELRKKIGAR